jgi:hypothetical protein
MPIEEMPMKDTANSIRSTRLPPVNRAVRSTIIAMGAEEAICLLQGQEGRVWEGRMALGPERLLRLWSATPVPTLLETFVMAEWCRTVARPILGSTSNQRSTVVFTSVHADAVVRLAGERYRAHNGAVSQRVTTASLAAAELRLVDAQTSGSLLATLVLMHALLAVSAAGTGIVLETLRRKTDPQLLGGIRLAS